MSEPRASDAAPSAGAETFAPALRRYFAKRAPGPDVEDLVQEVMVRMQGRQSPTEIDNLQGYVFTVAANVLKEARRKTRSIDMFHEDFDVSDGLTPERIVAARDDAARLLAAIDRLPTRTREIFIAHRFEELTYGRIAALFSISVSAVEKHIMAALKSLSAELKGRADE